MSKSRCWTVLERRAQPGAITFERRFHSPDEGALVENQGVAWPTPVATTIVDNDGKGAALTARDMAAQRRREAVLDGRHHLQLVEADLARIGSSPLSH